MLIGYARVSKNDGSQVLDMQTDALNNVGIEKQYIYTDHASGRHDERPGLNECLRALRDGDTLVVWKLDRLGRNVKHLTNLIDQFSKKNIGFKVLTGHGASIDTSTSHGKLVFGIFAALAEFEAALISERTKAGLAAARARGRFGGRPRKMDADTILIAIDALKENRITVRDLSKKLGVSNVSLYSYLNGDGGLKEAGQAIIDLYNKEKK